MPRERLGSRLGFILLSAGCAIGVGNVWKFPWMVGQYGGGAFVVCYVLFLLILGLPIMTMEFAIGRASQKSPVRAYQALEKPGSKWHIHGYLAMIGNYLLIYPVRQIFLGSISIPMWGAGLGTAGAAISTSASQFLLAGILLYILAKKSTPVQIPLFHSRYRIQKPLFLQMWRISFPVLLERLTLTSGQMALTAMISTLGTIPLAAHYLTNQTEGLLYLPAYGFSYTATALVGQSLGAKRGDLADKFAWNICIIGSVVIVAACIPVAILSGPVIRQMLAAFPGAIISISHDRKYIMEVCEKLYRLETHGLVETNLQSEG